MATLSLGKSVLNVPLFNQALFNDGGTIDFDTNLYSYNYKPKGLANININKPTMRPDILKPRGRGDIIKPTHHGSKSFY